MIKCMCTGLHVQCPLFLSDFSETWIFSTDFRKMPNIKFDGNPSSGSRFVPRGQKEGRGGQTDTTKQIVAFVNFANAPKISIQYKDMKV